MKITLFTVEEANRLAQQIRPTIERLVESRREFVAMQTRVDALGLALSGASAGNPDARVLRQLIERRNRVAEEIRQGVAAVQGRGCVVKDLERGLVDFYSLAGDRLIFLCWHAGEPEVSHWHTLEGGFATRQPLHRTEQE